MPLILKRQRRPTQAASTRLKAVIDALVAEGKPSPAATRLRGEALNNHDRQELVNIGQNPNNFDEIIFFERNA